MLEMISSKKIFGSGKGGRITKEDVQAHVAKQHSSVENVTTSESTTNVQSTGPRESGYERMRTTIANRLLHSKIQPV